MLDQTPERMTLRDWLHARNMSQTEFARRLSARVGQPVPVATVNRWAKLASHKLYTIPQPALVQAIRSETEGVVDGESWYPRDLTLPMHKPRGAAALAAA